MISSDQVRNSLKTILFLIVVPGIVLFFIPSKIVGEAKTVTLTFPNLRYLGIVFWLVGGLILLLCAKDFVSRGKGTPLPNDPPKELVAQGLYRYMRNPMYIGAILVLVGHFIWFQLVWLIIYATILFVCFHGFVTLYEEPTLAKKFGESYQQYLKTVPRWIPRFRS